MAITQILAMNMTEGAQERINQHFNRLDPFNDEIITRDTMIQVAMNCGLDYTISCNMIDNVLPLVGVFEPVIGIDLHRVKQMSYYGVCNRNSRYVDSIFEIFDDDSDGFIDVDEFSQVFDNETIQDLCLDENDMDHWKQTKSNQCTLMDTWIRAMIKEVDLDKDGKLSKQEFVNAMSDNLDWSVVRDRANQ